LAGAAQHNLDAGQQFTRIEGFDDVIIRAHLQPNDAIDRGPARGQHDHGDLRAFAKRPAQFEPVHARQHQVQHDEIGQEAFQHTPHGLAILRRSCDQPGIAKIFTEQIANIPIVIDDKDFDSLLLQAVLRA
jgi:hypothetical protein